MKNKINKKKFRIFKNTKLCTVQKGLSSEISQGYFFFISFQHEEGFFYVTVYLLYVQVGFKQTIASDQELSLLRRGVGGSAAYSNRRSRYSQPQVPTLQRL